MAGLKLGKVYIHVLHVISGTDIIKAISMKIQNTPSAERLVYLYAMYLNILR